MIRMIIICMMLMPTGAVAGAWDEFQARCLTPMEALFPPISDGLTLIEEVDDEARFDLTGGERFVIELAPEDGTIACHVATAMPEAETAFDQWIAEVLAGERYVPVEDASNLWHSNMWIEPVIGAEKRKSDGRVILRMVETDLES